MPIKLKCDRCGLEKIVPCPNEVIGGGPVPEFCERCGMHFRRMDECSDLVKPDWKPRGGPGGILE